MDTMEELTKFVMKSILIWEVFVAVNIQRLTIQTQFTWTMQGLRCILRQSFRITQENLLPIYSRIPILDLRHQLILPTVLLKLDDGSSNYSMLIPIYSMLYL